MKTKTFGSRVRTLRQARGWKPEELAERTGLGRDTVRRIERGEREDVHISTAIALADAFAVTLDELAGRNNSRNSP